MMHHRDKIQMQPSNKKNPASDESASRINERKSKMSTKYSTMYSKTQTRTGNGQFSQSRRVASNAELNAKAKRQAQNDADEAKRSQVQALGLGEYDYSEIFAA